MAQFLAILPNFQIFLKKFKHFFITGCSKTGCALAFEIVPVLGEPADCQGPERKIRKC